MALRSPTAGNIQSDAHVYTQLLRVERARHGRGGHCHPQAQAVCEAAQRAVCRQTHCAPLHRTPCQWRHPQRGTVAVHDPKLAIPKGPGPAQAHGPIWRLVFGLHRAWPSRDSTRRPPAASRTSVCPISDAKGQSWHSHTPGKALRFEGKTFSHSKPPTNTRGSRDHSSRADPWPSPPNPQLLCPPQQKPSLGRVAVLCPDLPRQLELLPSAGPLERRRRACRRQHHGHDGPQTQQNGDLRKLATGA